MEFSVAGALIAGLVGTAVMSLMMRMAARAGMTDMPPMELVMGSMMTGDPDRARRFGAMAHWLMMGTLAFGLGYAALFTAFDSASWLTGVAVGAVHGLAVGVVFMPMMPAMHPRMTTSPSFAGSVNQQSRSVQLAAPGLLGSRWGGMTPVGLLLGHIVYGLVVALVYSTFV